MGDTATVDLKIYHSNTALFQSLLQSHLDEYDYVAVMPHFYENIEAAYNTINKVPKERLLIMDKDISDKGTGYAAVYQDFKNDIVEALESALPLLGKYKKLILVNPLTPQYPNEILIGFRNFCMQNDFPFSVINEINNDAQPLPQEAYIVIEETDLVNLIKRCNCKKLNIGKDVGIISYNETPLKEILLEGITVISTDHAKMGEMAARLILDNRKEKIKNPFSLIVRKSL